MKSILSTLFTLLTISLSAQSASISGKLIDEDEAPVAYANVILYNSLDSTMVKVETSGESGIFSIKGLASGQYYLKATYVGLTDLSKGDIVLDEGQNLDLGTLSFGLSAVELEGATVTAQRALVEVKADRTVFNVQGTVNSAGADAIELLRKAPGLTVDNNDNINVLGRSGVLVYVDGKRLPLSGDDLKAYLQSLTADQIDKIDIISNPGAKYEAEGNAGIIDIRLKRDDSHGANGSVNASISQGKKTRVNLGVTGNYRNEKWNVFGNLGVSKFGNRNGIYFQNTQNTVFMDENNEIQNEGGGAVFRLGTDYFIHEKHTVGVLVGGRLSRFEGEGDNKIKISSLANRTVVDSVLIAQSSDHNDRTQYTFNVNYRYNGDKGESFNFDADYGQYDLDGRNPLRNTYYDGTETLKLSSKLDSFSRPSVIDIYTLKADYEKEVLGGQLGLGAKFSQVVSDNTFLVYNENANTLVRNDERSNQFDYDEKVYAAYLNFARPIHKSLNMSAGLRVESTDAKGILTAFTASQAEPPVKQDYLSLFPSFGLTWTVNPMNVLSLNYGRRINRPDYEVLNPFNQRLSELSYERGNPNLKAEIVNNIELGYTIAYRYNIKLSYSRTSDQVTRLIGPDENDPRASFIGWANLASQDVYNINAALPFQVTKWWSVFMNLNASYLDNQADYGNGAVVDVQAFTYSAYQQHTFTLPKGFKGELSGYYSGPGVWGGVFKYNANWSLNLGVQKRFFKDKLNVRLSANDIFFSSGWDGYSEFNGLRSEGRGNWDSRRVSLSVGYNFGNQKVKSRKRKTGLESESQRTGGQ